MKISFFIAGCLQGPASHAKRDLLLEIQAAAQKKWEAEKVFQVDAPATGKAMFRASFV